jgi:hypothetical protein
MPFWPNSRNSKLQACVVGFVLLVAAVTAVLWWLDARGGAAIGLAGSSDREDRIEAADRLGGKGSAAATEALKRLARDADKYVAVRAIRSLSQNLSERNRDILADLAQDKTLKGKARGEAAANYGKFKDADPTVLTQILAGDQDPEARAGAAKGLTRMRKPSTIPELVRGLEDRDPRVRLWSITAIHKMIVRRFPYDASQPPQRQQYVIQKIKTYLRSAGVL